MCPANSFILPLAGAGKYQRSIGLHGCSRGQHISEGNKIGTMEFRPPRYTSFRREFPCACSTSYILEYPTIIIIHFLFPPPPPPLLLLLSRSATDPIHPSTKRIRDNGIHRFPGYPLDAGDTLLEDVVGPSSRAIN